MLIAPNDAWEGPSYCDMAFGHGVADARWPNEAILARGPVTSRFARGVSGSGRSSSSDKRRNPRDL